MFAKSKLYTDGILSSCDEHIVKIRGVINDISMANFAKAVVIKYFKQVVVCFQSGIFLGRPVRAGSVLRHNGDAPEIVLLANSLQPSPGARWSHAKTTLVINCKATTTACPPCRLVDSFHPIQRRSTTSGDRSSVILIQLTSFLNAAYLSSVKPTVEQPPPSHIPLSLCLLPNPRQLPSPLFNSSLLPPQLPLISIPSSEIPFPKQMHHLSFEIGDKWAFSCAAIVDAPVTKPLGWSPLHLNLNHLSDTSTLSSLHFQLSM